MIRVCLFVLLWLKIAKRKRSHKLICPEPPQKGTPFSRVFVRTPQTAPIHFLRGDNSWLDNNNSNNGNNKSSSNNSSCSSGSGNNRTNSRNYHFIQSSTSSSGNFRNDDDHDDNDRYVDEDDQTTTTTTTTHFMSPNDSTIDEQPHTKLRLIATSETHRRTTTGTLVFSLLV